MQLRLACRRVTIVVIGVLRGVLVESIPVWNSGISQGIPIELVPVQVPKPTVAISAATVMGAPFAPMAAG